jgi:hypothetical protein
MGRALKLVLRQENGGSEGDTTIQDDVTAMAAGIVERLTVVAERLLWLPCIHDRSG